MHGAYREAAWFDPNCEEGNRARQECAEAALDDLVAWLSAGNDGRIAILDGSHTTLNKRDYALQRLQPLECKVRLYCKASEPRSRVRAGTEVTRLAMPVSRPLGPRGCPRLRVFRCRLNACCLCLRANNKNRKPS